MLEYVMLGFFLAIYTKKYWLKLIGEIMIFKDNKTKTWYYLSLCLLFGGLVVFIIGSFLKQDQFYQETYGLWMDSGLFIFSSGLASLGVSFAIDSSYKMKSIANVQFLQVLNMLEDARAMYIGGKYKPDLFGWKTQSCVEMAVELLKRDEKKRFIESDYQDKLFHYFNMSFNHLFKYPNWETETDSVNTGVSNFTKAYAMLVDYYNTLRKSEFDRDLRLEPKIDYDEFYSRVDEIKRTENYDIL